LTAQQNNNSVRLCRDKSKQENILCAAVVALENRVTKGGLRMKLNFLMSGANEMIDNMGGCCIATSTAKPLATSQTLHDAAWRMNATVPVEISPT
jgi:hypothetical protein